MGRISVTLDPGEIWECFLVAVDRNVESMKKKLTHRARYNTGESMLFNEWLGCCGEFAVAKLRREPWDATVNTFHSKRDQGPFEIRTRSKDYYELFLRDGDELEAPWVLVTCENWRARRFDVRGWIWGNDAKEVGEWKDFGGRGKPVLVVPTEKLGPAGEIEEWER